MKVLLLLLLTFAGAPAHATYPADADLNRAHTVQAPVNNPPVHLTVNNGAVRPDDAPKKTLMDQHPPPTRATSKVRRARFNIAVKHTFVYPPSAPTTRAAPTRRPTTRPTRSPTKAPFQQPTRQPTKRALSPINRPTIKAIPSLPPSRQAGLRHGAPPTPLAVPWMVFPALVRQVWILYAAM
jgi:hypothetical protein